MKTLILGIGNPILRDDGIGPRVVKELQGLISDPDTTILETNIAGINLMELLTGFDRAIIIDAIKTGGKAGGIYWLTPDDFGVSQEDFYSQHGVGILQAVYLGRDLAQPMPEEVAIVAIEAEDVHSFGEGLTADVEKTVPVVRKQILAKLEEWQND